MKQAVISVPMRRERIGQLAGSYADRLATRGLLLTLSAWAITYGGAYLGASVLAGTGDGSALVMAVVLVVVTALVGTSTTILGIRRLSRSLQVASLTMRTKLTSVTGLVVGFLFFAIPAVMGSAVSLWAIL